MLDVGIDLGSLDLSFNNFNGDNIWYYCLGTHWDLLILKCLYLMKASYWDGFMVK